MEDLKITDVNKSINLNNNSNENIENNNNENNNNENNNNENNNNENNNNENNNNEINNNENKNNEINNNEINNNENNNNEINNNENNNNEINNNEINNNEINNTNNNNNNNQNKIIDDKNNTSKSDKNDLLNSNSQFFQKITIENFPSKEDLLYITESFFKDKNYFPKIFNNKKTISFILDNEDLAYNFTMQLNKEKFSNPSYENTNITLTFEQNKNYKKEDKKNKKKLTNENINRLYKGINPNENKKKNEFNNNNNKKSVYEDNKNLLIFPYAEEFKIKDINIKNKTNKLSDSEPYQPKSNFKFREVNKNKWVSSKEFNNL